MPIESLALRFVAAADEVAGALPDVRRYLADQLRRAAASVYLNLREGLGEFSPLEKARFYRMAYRSLIEALGCIPLAVLFVPGLARLGEKVCAIGDQLGPQLHRLVVYQRRRKLATKTRGRGQRPHPAAAGGTPAAQAGTPRPKGRTPVGRSEPASQFLDSSPRHG